MNSKKVCVITPVYNGEKTIKLALKSLLLQTYQNWVCVIVNDGSTDRTKAILDSLTDPRFKVIHLPQNKGRGYARQVCLDNAEGDYLAYLDADDFYHIDKLMLQVRVLDNNENIWLVGHKALVFDASYKGSSVRGINSTNAISFKIGDQLKLVMPSAMIRLEQAKNYKYNSNLNASEDNEYFSRYLDGKHYTNINDILLYYSVTESTNYRKILEYTQCEIVRGITLFGKNDIAALKVTSISIIKWFAYLILIPFLGVDFFLSRRGHIAEEKDINSFNDYKNILNNNNTL